MALSLGSMNVRKLKILLWLGVIAVFGAAGLKAMFMFESWRRGDFHPKPQSTYIAIIEGGFESSEESTPTQDDKKPHSHYTRMWESPLNGHIPDPPKPPEPDEVEPTPVERRLDPLEDILLVSNIMYSSRGDGLVAVQYQDDEPIVSVDEYLLGPGSKLKFPHDEEPGFGEVLRIDPDAVVFSWGGEEVTLRPAVGGSHLAEKKEEKDAASSNLSDREQEALAKYRGSDDTVELKELGKDHFLIGRNVQSRFGNQQFDLGSMVRASNQKRGKGDSEVVIRTVRPEVSRTYGVQGGDVLISINGTPVSSKSQAINYVRQNPDEPKYEVVIQRLGKPITKVFYPPEDDE